METNRNELDRNELRELARKKVIKIKGFYIHLFFYTLAITIYILKVYAGIRFDFLPFKFINGFVMTIWTIVFLSMAVDLFISYRMFGIKWEEQKLNSILEKKQHLKKMEITETYNKYDDRYLEAKKKVENIKGFYGNLISFIVVNLFLLVINLVYSPEHLWFFWPLMWWGLGVVIHGLKVFNAFPVFAKDWQEKKIKELMDKEKSRNEKWQ
ncbi:2TM domain-containing protein [Flavobacterium pisciphilum]